MTNLFDQVHATLGGKPNRRGWYDVTCPACGKEPHRGQVHFGYRETGGRCFVCGWSGNIKELAELLNMEPGEYVAPVREVERVEIARWRMNPWKLLQQYRDHPMRVELWQEYKPLDPVTIERFDFGVGRLPFLDAEDCWYMSRYEWLTLPIYEDGALVALRGRNMGNRGPKWISATGSQYALWNVDKVRAGAVCWLSENYVDAAWAMQEHPEWDAVAIGGATTWKREWAMRLAARKPAQIIVALDNDLPGNGGGAKRAEWVNDWMQEHPGMAAPEANGPKIVADLKAAGVPARLFVWPENAPIKAGLDWALENAA